MVKLVCINFGLYNWNHERLLQNFSEKTYEYD